MTRTEKPRMVWRIITASAMAASGASTIPRCSRVPPTSTGMRYAAGNSRDSGKPKPAGSFIGPRTSQSSSSAAT